MLYTVFVAIENLQCVKLSHTHLYDVVYSIVVSLSDVHTNGLQDHPVATGPLLDGVCTGDHLRVAWTAEWTGLSHTTA